MFKANDKVKFIKGQLKGKCGTVIDTIKGWSFIEDNFSEEKGIVISVEDGFKFKEKLCFKITVYKDTYKLIEKIVD